MNETDENNLPEELRDLEDRLARRAVPAPDERFRRRVLDAVACELRHRRPRLRWWLAAAAACLAVAAALLLRPQDEPRTPQPPIGPAAVESPPPPTFMAYRRALQVSPERFEALLACHGRTLLRRSDDEQDARPRWRLDNDREERQ